MNNTINGYTTDVTKVAAAAKSRIVTVTAWKENEQLRIASGIIYYSDSGETDILTNARVLLDADRVMVRFDSSVELQAVIAGSDSQTDLALLKTQPSFEATPLTLTDSDVLHQGEYVIAMGGRRSDSGAGTVSFGVASSASTLERPGDAGAAAWIDSVLESDISLNPSNSGGPLLNLSGEAVGILSSNLSSAAGNSGMAYAITSNEARLVAEQLRTAGAVTRGYLGVTGRNVSGMENYEKNALSVMLDQTTGVYVMSVAADSPAMTAEIIPGDIILAVDDAAVASTADLLNALYKHKPEDEVSLTVLRGQEVQAISAVLK